MYRIVAKFLPNETIPDAYFIYSLVSAMPFYNDDRLNYLDTNFTITLFSKGDYSEMLKDTIAALDDNEIKILSIAAELYDVEIDYYQISINVSIIDDWEGLPLAQ